MSARVKENEEQVRSSSTLRYGTRGVARLQVGGAPTGYDEYGRRSARQERQEVRARRLERGKGERPKTGSTEGRMKGSDIRRKSVAGDPPTYHRRPGAASPTVNKLREACAQAREEKNERLGLGDLKEWRSMVEELHRLRELDWRLERLRYPESKGEAVARCSVVGAVNELKEKNDEHEEERNEGKEERMGKELMVFDGSADECAVGGIGKGLKEAKDVAPTRNEEGEARNEREEERKAHPPTP